MHEIALAVLIGIGMFAVSMILILFWEIWK